MKWIISKHVKAFAGLSTQSTKPVPKQWRWLLKGFYEVIDSKHETDAYIKLEILHQTLDRLKSKKKNHLHTALKNLESWFPKIIAHQQNPFISTTNNLLERFHKKYTYYQSLKRNMMTPEEAQRVLDYRVFRHNFGKYPEYREELQTRYKEFRIILTELPNWRLMAGHGHYLKSEFKKLDEWIGNYQQLFH